MTSPRVGFLGTGWIGRHRMSAIAATRAVDVVALHDPSDECAREACRLIPEAAPLPSLDALLDADLDGVVIATPSALHAEQAMAVLDRGMAVFCQKPLGRTAHEARRVVDGARTADRLLAVDFSYRHTAAAAALAELVRAGALGDIFAADLVFHNAYGPDKRWFYDPAQSGGGCLMDLGVHLADLVLWLTGFPAVDKVTSRIFAAGRPLAPGTGVVEDYAVARFDLATGATVQLACSWQHPVEDPARSDAGQERLMGQRLHRVSPAAGSNRIAGGAATTQVGRAPHPSAEANIR